VVRTSKDFLKAIPAPITRRLQGFYDAQHAESGCRFMRAEVSHPTLIYAVKKERPQYSCNSHKRVKYLHVFFTNETRKKRPEPLGAAPAGIYLN